MSIINALTMSIMSPSPPISRLLGVEVEFKVVVRDEEDHLRIGAEAEGPEDVKSD